MSGKLEIDIQKEIENYLDKNKIFHFRSGADGTKSGLPDVVMCYKGRFVALELKKPKTGKAQGHQKTIAKLIEKSGGITAFPRSLKEVIQIIQRIDRDVVWER